MKRRYIIGHICEADGCQDRVDSHGFCQFHRRRWQRYGDPLAGPPRRPQSGSRTATPTYRTVHGRMVRWLGTPSVCDHCGTTEAGRYEWSLRHDASEIRRSDRGYRFSSNPSDYERLCKACHVQEDKRVREAMAS